MRTTDTIVRDGIDADIDAIRRIASICYPADWPAAPVDQADRILVVEAPGEGVVGYATIERSNQRGSFWECSRQYISDLAVLPDHKKHSGELIRALARYLRRQGGVWTAHCRGSTSYRLLRLYERRRLLTILSARPSGTILDEPMYDVSFELSPITGASRPPRRPGTTG